MTCGRYADVSVASIEASKRRNRYPFVETRHGLRSVSKKFSTSVAGKVAGDLLRRNSRYGSDRVDRLERYTYNENNQKRSDALPVTRKRAVQIYFICNSMKQATYCSLLF